MSKTDGLQTRCYIGGYDISGDVSAISSIADSQNLLDVTGLDKAAIERLPLLQDGAAAINGWFNRSAGQIHAALLASGKVPSADRAVLIPLQTTVGGVCFFIIAKEANYNVNRGADGSLAVSSEFKANGYGIEWGQMLTAGKRTDASAANGVSVNGGAQSTAGASAVVQVFSLASGDVVPIIQDSANDTDFTAITGLTFASVGTGAVPTAQRLATAAGATIRQYVRIATTGTFTTAIVAAGFKRG